MSAFLAAGAYDAKLDYVETNATEIHLTFGDPANRATVLSSSHGSTSPTFTGPTDNGAGGRQTVVEQWQIASATNGGNTAATVCNISGTELLQKTDLSTTLPVNNGDTITIASYIMNASAAVLV